MPIPRPSSFFPGYPKELENILMHCLERDPDLRYQDAWSLHLDLEGFLRSSKHDCSSEDIANLMQQIYPRGAAPLLLRNSQMGESVEQAKLPISNQALYDDMFSQPMRGISYREIALMIAILLFGSALTWAIASWALNS